MSSDQKPSLSLQAVCLGMMPTEFKKSVDDLGIDAPLYLDSSVFSLLGELGIADLQFFGPNFYLPDQDVGTSGQVMLLLIN